MSKWYLKPTLYLEHQLWAAPIMFRAPTPAARNSPNLMAPKVQYLPYGTTWSPDLKVSYDKWGSDSSRGPYGNEGPRLGRRFPGSPMYRYHEPRLKWPPCLSEAPTPIGAPMEFEALTRRYTKMVSETPTPRTPMVFPALLGALPYDSHGHSYSRVN